jgi:hypothetical protein
MSETLPWGHFDACPRPLVPTRKDARRTSERADLVLWGSTHFVYCYCYLIYFILYCMCDCELLTMVRVYIEC